MSSLALFTGTAYQPVNRLSTINNGASTQYSLTMALPDTFLARQLVQEIADRHATEALFMMREEYYHRQELVQEEENAFTELADIFQYARNELLLSSHHAAELRQLITRLQETYQLGARCSDIELLSKQLEEEQQQLLERRQAIDKDMKIKDNELAQARVQWEQDIMPAIQLHITSLRRDLESINRRRAQRDQEAGQSQLMKDIHTLSRLGYNALVDSTISNKVNEYAKAFSMSANAGESDGAQLQLQEGVKAAHNQLLGVSPPRGSAAISVNDRLLGAPGTPRDNRGSNQRALPESDVASAMERTSYLLARANQVLNTAPQ